MKCLLTVFTPTYNRAYCLHKCYDSLRRQTVKNFEWLIIDDGSDDNTGELVKKWMSDPNDFKIKYIYKVNGGMHTAYNVAYENIDTELCINVDSDDYLVDNAIEKICKFWEKNKQNNIGGIYALDQFENGEIVGRSFPCDLKSFHGWGYKIVFYCVDGGKKKYVNKGDKKFIGVTKVVQQFPPIPVFEGEKYYSLYYKQHLIEQNYTILILNEPVCVVEYMEDGSTKNMWKQYVNNPQGFRNERKFVMANAPVFKLKYEAAIHYVAESLLANNMFGVKESSNKLLTFLAIPFGVCLYILIRSKTK